MVGTTTKRKITLVAGSSNFKQVNSHPRYEHPQTRKNPNCLPVRIFLAIFDLRRRHCRSCVPLVASEQSSSAKIKRKMDFPFVFCSLIRIFAAASDFLPKVWRFQKKFVILQRVRRKDAMTYILQKTEIKNASHKLIEVVKKLGEEKHAKMEELRSHTNFTYTIKV